MALIGTVATAAGQEMEEPQRIVDRVTIDGNRAFSDDQIKRVIATRESGCKSLFLQPFCWIGLGAARRKVAFDPRELRTDMARIRVFYFRRGYRNVEVDTSVVSDDERVDITFLVEEGSPVLIRDLQVAGIEEILDSASVATGLPIQRGDPFSELAIAEAQDQIARTLRNRGYARAEVLVDAWLPFDSPTVADVVLRADPGQLSRIGEIEVIGTREVEPRSVRRLLTFRSGDIYRESEIVRSQRNLYSLALFEYVDLAPNLEGEDTLIDVRVQVNEADVRDVRLGLGLTTAECVQVEAGWTHRNFFGGTRRLELSATVSNILTAQLAETFPCQEAGIKGEGPSAFNKLDWGIRADFQQPWFISSRNSLRLGLFAERQSLPRIFARQTFGGDITLARELSTGMPLTLLYRSERDRLEEGSAGFLFCASFGICRPEDIDELEETRWLSSVRLSLTRNQTDVVFDPTRGYRLSVEVEHGSGVVLSDYLFNRVQGELSSYRNVGSGSVLAVRIRGGWVRPIGRGIDGPDVAAARAEEQVTHPLKRMYAGGPTTVRGYGQNLLGPKVLKMNVGAVEDLGCDPAEIDTTQNTWTCDPTDPTPPSSAVDPRPVGGLNMLVGNLELRFPLFSARWRGAAFVDVGQVWTGGEAIRVLDDLAWSPGVGVRYLSPVGPLRLDIGYNTGGVERRPAVAELDNQEIVQLVGTQGEPVLLEYDPFDERGLRAFLSRLQLNFSIGQAF